MVVPVCQPHSPASKSQLNSTSGLVSVVVEVASPCTLHTGASLLPVVTAQLFSVHLQPGVRLTSSMAMSPCCPSATVASTWTVHSVWTVCIYPCPRHQQPEFPAVVGGGQLHVQLLPHVVVLAVGGPRAEQVVLRVAQAGSSYIELDIS